MSQGGHGGHDMPMPGGPHEPQCYMDMLWNTNVLDTCIVFRSWHITSYTGFVLSFFAIVLLGVFYEYLRIFQRRFDRQLARTLVAKPGRTRSRRSSSERNEEEAGLLTGRGRDDRKIHLVGTPVPQAYRLIRAGLYAVTVFLSFFLMLVFMTYNAYLIFAVVLGAGVGHFVFGATLDTDAILGDTAKGMACH